MYLKRSMLCLLALSALFANSAIARSVGGCVKYTEKKQSPSIVSVRLGEQETALVEVNGNAQGVTKCSIVKGSGSEQLDGASCSWVKDNWRSLGRCQDYGPHP